MAVQKPKWAAAKGIGSLLLSSVRVLGAFILAMTSTAGAAGASSFVVMGETAPVSTPSIVTLGLPAPAKVAGAKAGLSSWADKPIDQLQRAFPRMKQADRRLSPSVESLSSGATETPSIIALGEPAPEIAYEKVAAIPRKSKRGPMFKPLVIRGGVVGDAFAPATNAGPSAAPAPGKQNGSSQAAASGGQSPSAPPSPAPAAPPPAVVPKGTPE